ncbi:hypothetical protein E1A91_D09G168100v1 [Gossypium mustelinum]|uniref:Uncharacterized protein n=1 Tax=Gossypium mustelinum TaxID=34275 RepID=A0A5D2TMW2_GOSMU|nr:hypothetical protein E1A91_D09G168100v1 [Gossypium mustelinum]
MISCRNRLAHYMHARTSCRDTQKLIPNPPAELSSQQAYALLHRKSPLTMYKITSYPKSAQNPPKPRKMLLQCRLNQGF